MPSFRQSLAWNALTQQLVNVLGFLSVMVLARLLTPTEIGIASVGLAMVGLAHVFRDFGVGKYIVQEPELTPVRIQTALGLGMIVSWSIGGLLFLSSEPLGAFYGDAGVGEVLRILSINFFLIPFNVPALGLLNRAMNFRALMVIRSVGGAGGALATIGFAAGGFSYKSAAWGSVLGVLVTIAVTTLFCGRETIRRPSLVEWRRVFRYSRFVTGSAALDALGFHAPDLVLGRIVGFEGVAVINRALGIVRMFGQAVTSGIAPVAFANWARMFREGLGIKSAYLKGVSYLCVIAWPFFLVLSIDAFYVIRILFGDQWDAAVPLLRIIAVSGLIQPFMTLIPDVLNATGHERAVFMYNICIHPLRIGAILVAALWGLEAVAWVMVASTGGSVILLNWHLNLAHGVGLLDIWRTARSSSIVALLVAVPNVGLIWIFGEDVGLLYQFAVLSLTSSFLAWSLGVFLVRHPIRAEIMKLVAFLWARLRPEF